MPLDELAAPYAGRILEPPTITGSLVETLWGPVRVEDATVSLAVDDMLKAGYTRDLVGQVVTIARYDRRSGYTLPRFTGVVEEPTLEPGKLTLRARNLDLSIFDALLPRGTITPAEFPFAVDVGQVLTVVRGRVGKVPLRYISDDVVNSQFDYLIARGEVAVPALYRQAVIQPGGEPDIARTLINPSEYEISTTAYPCYTTAHFPLRQTDISGAFVPIWADVIAPDDRSFPSTLAALLSDSWWGLGRAIDAESFAAARVLLDRVGPLFCDLAMVTQDKAANWLSELLMVFGMRLSITEAGTIAIRVDAGPQVVRMDLFDGPDGDGERNILDCQRTKMSGADRISTLRLRYRENLSKPGAYFYTQSRVVNRFVGSEKPYTNRAIRNHETADRVTDNLAWRIFNSQDRATIHVTQRGRDLREGELVRVRHEATGYDGDTLQIRGYEDPLDEMVLHCVGWRPYTYRRGLLPPEGLGGFGGLPPVGEPPPSDPGGGGGGGGGTGTDWGYPGSMPYLDGAGRGGVQGVLDRRGWRTSAGTLPYGAAVTIPKNTVITVALTWRSGRGIRPTSLRLWDAPVMAARITPAGTPGPIWDARDIPGNLQVTPSPESQRITDDGAGGLQGDVGAGPNTVAYDDSYALSITFAKDATTPLIFQVVME